MDRQERFDFQHNVEGFLDQKGVYELFESLLKDLVAKRPSNPIDYMIERLQKPLGKPRARIHNTVFIKSYRLF